MERAIQADEILMKASKADGFSLAMAEASVAPVSRFVRERSAV